jgi:hypothetical protein
MRENGKPFFAPDNDLTEPELETVDGADLLRVAYAEPRFVIEHMVAERGITLVSSDTGGGKTATLMHASVALALGEPVAGRFLTVSADRPVLYVNGEMSGDSLRQYLHQAVAALAVPLPPGRIYFEGAAGLAAFRFRTADCARLERLVERLRPVLVIFDTMRALFEVDENDAGDVRRPFSYLRQLCESHACAAVVAHHVRKIGQVSNSDRERVSGSRDIIAAVDIHVVLKSYAGRPLHAIKIDKTRFPHAGVAVGTEWPVTARLEPGTPPRSIILAAEPTSPEVAAKKVADAESAILDRLEAEGPLTIAALGSDRGNAKRAFEALRKARTVVEVGKVGRKTLYGLADVDDAPLLNAVKPDRTRDRTRVEPNNDEGSNAVSVDRTPDRTGRFGDENVSPRAEGGDLSSSSSNERGQRSAIYSDLDRDRTRENTGGGLLAGRSSPESGVLVAEAML